MVSKNDNNIIWIIGIIIVALLFYNNSGMFSIVDVSEDYCISGKLELNERETVKGYFNLLCNSEVYSEDDFQEFKSSFDNITYSPFDEDITLLRFSESKKDSLLSCFYYQKEDGHQVLETYYDILDGPTMIIVGDFEESEINFPSEEFELSDEVVHKEGYKNKEGVLDLPGEYLNFKSGNTLVSVKSEEPYNFYMNEISECIPESEVESKFVTFFKQYGLTSGMGLIILVLSIIVIVLLIGRRK